nr:PREDICTED: phosphoacetylglucosamine mutase-like [Bemisia tabaci]
MNFPMAFYDKSPKYSKNQLGSLHYGTAGFRTRAENLGHVAYRVGIIAALRSRVRNGQAIGVMITASHNPEDDNGIKIVDPMGEMLEGAWETYATDMVNTPDASLEQFLQRVIATHQVNLKAKSLVFLGWDTRPSSLSLSIATSDGVESMGGKLNSIGLTSTPIIHFLVMCWNTNEEYGRANEAGYYSKLSSAFNHVHNVDEPKKLYTPEISVDCANGVGALVLKKMIHFLQELQSSSSPNKKSLKINLFNDLVFVKDVLNNECGADFVKVQQKIPIMKKKDGSSLHVIPNARYASVDGDADRIIYYYVDDSGIFHLLDGDRIAILVAGYLKELIKKTGINIQVGLVQTAYANGSSTKYAIEKLNIPVAWTLTGVKHLHHKAKEFDIGVYFEANGHGTVLFNSRTVEHLTKLLVDERNGLSEDQKANLKKLLVVRDVINETVGDAIADLLLVEAILYDSDWNIQQWLNLYDDLPNRQLKVSLQDCSVVKTEGADVKCIAPAGLQQKINSLVKNYPSGRAFIRPSGTENFVRIYAEADSQKNADSLAAEVAQAVHSLAGNVGDLYEHPL